MDESTPVVVDVAVEAGRVVEEGTVLREETISRPLLFAELHKLAHEHVQYYQGDFYHDVIWLNSYVPTGIHRGDNSSYVFFYGCRDTGTHIGEDEQLCVKYNDMAWRVTIENKDRRGNDRLFQHYVTIHRIK